MCVYSLSVGLIVLPLALVDVPICVDEPAPSVGLVLPPEALVPRPVQPDLDTTTVTLV